MEVFFLWVGLSILAGVIAEKKGRSWFGFFVLSLLLSPIIGLLAAFVAAPDIALVERRQLISGVATRCSFCAELIKAEAIKCKHCGSDLTAKPQQGETASSQPIPSGPITDNRQKPHI